MTLKLYGYWRSSAAFRVRIALNLKGIDWENIPVNIAPGKDEHTGEDHRARNPQMRVPVLEGGEGMLSQSMAILEWLEAQYPEPSILPSNAWERAQCRAFANIIACDIHPLNNLSVLRLLKQDFQADQAAISDWYAHWIKTGFAACEAIASTRADAFLFGHAPTMAEILLVPQMWNARRFDVDLTAFPRLKDIEARCMQHEAFAHAAPENQPDAVA